MLRMVSQRACPRRVPVGRWPRLALVALAAVAVSQTACGGSGSSGADAGHADGGPALTVPAADLAGARQGGTLTFDRNVEPLSLNPIGPTDAGSIDVQLQIFDQMVEYDPGSLTPKPGIAAAWTRSTDGLTYDFKLRDASFSNGAPVTARDVVFSLQRFADPKVNQAYGSLVAPIERISSPAPGHVRITLSKPFPALLDYLTLFAASITPEQAVKQLGSRFDSAPVGSGPFMLKRWTRGQSLELVRNPHYWRAQRPFLDAVTFKFVKDDNTRVIDVKSGQADVAENVPFSQIADLRGASGIRVSVQPTSLIASVFLYDPSIPALNDRDVRQALNYATPRDQINHAVLGGVAQPANSVIPRLRFWDASVAAYPYDLGKAKQLMASSTAPHGFPLTLTIDGSDSNVRAIAQILQQSWGKIGVNVKIRQLDTAALGQELFAFKYQAAMFPLNAIASDIAPEDEQAAAYYVYGDQYRGFFSGRDNPTITRLAQQALVSLDDAKRESLYRRIQRLALDDAQNVPLFFVPSVTALRSSVHNFRTIINSSWDLSDVWMEG
jgi:peptide/nickel transport system substrate-binding protein